MTQNAEMKRKKKFHIIPFFIGGAVLSVCGLAVIPPIVDGCSRWVYKHTMTKKSIDFNKMGPKIVRK